MAQLNPGHMAVHERFKAYNRDIKDVWASYVFLGFYLPKLHTAIKTETLPTLELESLSGVTKSSHTKNKNDTFGALSHIQNKVVPIRTLIAGVATTEDFLKDLCILVYERFPAKLSNDIDESSEQRQKILQTILTSATREEILSRLIEERVRSIFYGNVTDFFTKDKKTKLEFGDYFSKSHSINMDYFKEILARRNILSHNDGKVDAKYLRESKLFSFNEGQRPQLTFNYLRHSLVVLRGLSAVAASLVCENIFKQPSVRGKLATVRIPFETNYSNAARTSGKCTLTP